MHITVSLVVNLIAAGMTMGEISRDYPYSTPGGIVLCLSYASRAEGEEIMQFHEAAAVHWLPTAPTPARLK